ncbi:M4 family metallopeptidase [Bacillus solimangrovi]|uniref:Neutral metalloproteinase n=1 Tax=Bacillus solimangrovi TaxID=1305675 RepID=A0A1E5LHM9_9BACI|nr:M4 family metallopeptidase [Bacillus solimangrovi]OEH93571.1 peptidase M4 [Bacillus solimangrovi]
MKKNWKKAFSTVALSTVLLTSQAGFVGAEANPDWKLNSEVESIMKIELNGPTFLKGKLTDQIVTNEADIRKFFKVNENLFKFNPDTKLKFTSAETDELGITHYSYQPQIQNIRIDQSRILVHVNKDGEIIAINGEFHPNAPDKIKQTKDISKKDAKQVAWDYINIDREKANNTVELLNDEEFESLKESTELVIYHENGAYLLTYHVQLQFAYPSPGNWDIWVNAENGEIIEAENNVHEVMGTGVGVLGDTKSINTYENKNSYILYDTTKPMNGAISTFDIRNQTSNLPGEYVADRDNVFDDERQRAAVDAHYYAGEVFDYYYDTFGRVSYDNQGSDIISTVHYGNSFYNAIWNGNQMLYGDGDGITYTDFSSADDVVGHELTHAVIDSTADFGYQGQTGALNESFADVFGYFVDNEDWLLGEDLFVKGGAIRSFSDPTQLGQPDHMDDYVSNGGAHTNSGIPNKAAYITINAIGQAKAEQVYYRALTIYLTPNSDFAYARQSLIQAAEDLYGTSVADEVRVAWDNVGVYE